MFLMIFEIRTTLLLLVANFANFSDTGDKFSEPNESMGQRKYMEQEHTERLIYANVFLSQGRALVPK